MQRLVYSPKVQAYIQTDDGILDISPFITGGTVSRVVNEVSTAELTIRNPDKRFTDPGNPSFRPMDVITIFASRFSDRPVQLFTGYLDETPYHQLFPGTCTLRASCTLKRLLYTYFDAGLSHTHAFLKKYHWLPQTQTGTVTSPNQQQTTRAAESGKGDFTDGSVGNLMAAFLHEVGNWGKDEVLVEEFPKGAGKTVQDMVNNVSASTKEAEEEFRDFLSRVVGDYTGGGTVTTPGGASTNSGETPQQVYCVGVSMNVPERHLLGAMMVGLVECPCSLDSGIEGCTGSGGFGNCDQRIGEIYGDGLSAGWRQEQFAYFDDPMNVAASARRFFNTMRANDSGQSLGVLCQETQRSAHPERYAAVQGQAESLLRACQAKGCNSDPDDPPMHNI